MKKFIFLSLLISMSTISKAEAKGRILCNGLTPSEKELTVIVEKKRNQLIMTIEVDSQVIHVKKAVEEPWPDRIYFTSEEFINANGAPANLLLHVWHSDSGEIGQFSEVSFLPEIQEITQLTCQRQGS